MMFPYKGQAKALLLPLKDIKSSGCPFVFPSSCLPAVQVTPTTLLIREEKWDAILYLVLALLFLKTPYKDSKIVWVNLCIEK